MRPLLSRAEAQAHDREVIARGVPGILLMESAGRGATDVLVARMGDRLRTPLIVGGLGQNGGDAWCVARHLVVRGYAPRVIVVGDPARIHGDARIELDALAGVGVAAERIGEGDLTALERALPGASVIVDGVFGTGLDRAIEGHRAELLRLLAGSGVPSFALDLPSGVDADTGQVLGIALPAVLTATFAAEKRGLLQHPGASLAGEVVIADIGAPAPRSRMHVLERDDLRTWLRPRARDAHKGSAGHVAIFAGSAGRTGAAMLSGLGAIRAGAGLVTLAPRGAGARAALDAKVVELMTTELPEALEAGVLAALRECAGKASAVIGPGVGLDTAARAFVLRMLREAPLPLVVDADALTALADAPADALAASHARILTPHPGEASRLLGTTSAEVQHDRHGAAVRLAERTGAVIVLKGAGTVIASPDGAQAVCPLGTPALGVAGTGDVLSGVVATLAGALPPFEAACAGVVLHALAGSHAARADRGLLAREVADALPSVLAASLAGEC